MLSRAFRHASAGLAVVCLAVLAFVYSPLRSTEADLAMPLDKGGVRLDEVVDMEATDRHCGCW